jgi:hypothetical protein
MDTSWIVHEEFMTAMGKKQEKTALFGKIGRNGRIRQEGSLSAKTVETGINTCFI